MVVVDGSPIRSVSAPLVVRTVSGSPKRSISGCTITTVSASSIRWESGSAKRSVSGRRIRTVGGSRVRSVSASLIRWDNGGSPIRQVCVSWILMLIGSVSSGALIAGYVDVLIMAAVMDAPSTVRTPAQISIT